jgi:hypothetical protein
MSKTAEFGKKAQGILGVKGFYNTKVMITCDTSFVMVG